MGKREFDMHWHVTKVSHMPLWQWVLEWLQ